MSATSIRKQRGELQARFVTHGEEELSNTYGTG